MQLIRTLKTALAVGAFAAAAVTPALAQEVVRIAYIDPFSGLMAPVGANGYKGFQEAVAYVNEKKLAGPNIKFEMVQFDNKLSPQESLNVLKQAIDRGVRYITQGNGSGVALALQDAIEKHNERNPDKPVMFLNYAAVDPDMTNQKCSFWHFRFDANSDMKMEALTTWMAKQTNIKNVYLFNQNYAFGVQVERAAKEYLGRKRPDIKIVGAELHPLAQVKDFAPYVQKIKASGADSVITGNWGNDLSLLIKAAKDANLNVNFYTYYAGVIGTPTAMGAAAENRVFSVTYAEAQLGLKGEPLKFYENFVKKHKEEFYTWTTWSIPHMLAEAMVKAKSTEPLKVAYALEGMKSKGPFGDVEMRATDHQMQQHLLISSWQKKDGKRVLRDSENTGFGWRTEVTLDPYVAAQPTSCQMKRPPRPAG
jgi:branched-chain amino acid transport system substrate-binding protein